MKKLTVKSISSRFEKNAPSRKDRVYIDFEDETLLENFSRRDAKPSRDFKEFVLDELVRARHIEDETTLSWSRTAGCGCGCSPGFIASSRKGRVIFITISAA